MSEETAGDPSADISSGKEGSSVPACTVLLVEDNRLTSKIVKNLLVECKFAVIVANNGREALDILKNRGGKAVNVVLTDNFMPESSGLDLIEKMAQSDDIPRVPTVLMSANSDKKLVDHAFRAGASGFLVKPVKRSELQDIWQLAIASHNSSKGHVKKHVKVESFDQEIPTPFKSAFAPVESHHNFEPVSCKRSGSDTLTQATDSKKTRVMDQSVNVSLKADYENLQPVNGAQLRTEPATEKSWSDEMASSQASNKIEGSLPEREQKAGPATALARAASAPHFRDVSYKSAACLAEMLGRYARKPASSALDKNLEIKPLDLSKSLSSCLEYQTLHGSEDSKTSDHSSHKQSQQSQQLAESYKHLQHSSKSAFTAILPRSSVTTSHEVEAKNCDTIEAAASSTPCFWPVGFPASQHLFLQHNIAQVVHAAMQQQYSAKQHQNTVRTCAATRKAAIEKFRAKRQQRNFDKTVRYASRKRLADTRPRVRGQFVKADVVATIPATIPELTGDGDRANATRS